VEQYG